MAAEDVFVFSRDEKSRILAKEDARPTYYKNRVNAGLHVIDPKVLDMVSIDADWLLGK